MEQLVEQMKTVLATTFSLYLKSHNYHWNVTGPDFGQYHDFFGQFYEDVHASIDPIAEHIRGLDEFAPGSYTRFSQLTKITDETTIPQPAVMFSRLASDNDIVIAEMYKAADMADEARQRGLVNFLEDRIDFHEKMRWQLKSFS